MQQHESDGWGFHPHSASCVSKRVREAGDFGQLPRPRPRSLRSRRRVAGHPHSALPSECSYIIFNILIYIKYNITITHT